MRGVGHALYALWVWLLPDLMDWIVEQPHDPEYPLRALAETTHGLREMRDEGQFTGEAWMASNLLEQLVLQQVRGHPEPCQRA